MGVGGLTLEYKLGSIENIDGLDNVGLGTGPAVVSGMDTAGKIKGMGGPGLLRHRLMKDKHESLIVV